VKEGFGKNKEYGFGLEYQILDDKNFSWMFTGKMKPNDFRTLCLEPSMKYIRHPQKSNQITWENGTKA